MIFQKVGLEGLLKDLPLYCFGLFPFFEYASSSVRSEFLDMIRRYFLPLGDKLCEPLRNLVLALLPGLEDESAEGFSKTFQCLEAIGKCVGMRNLLEALWMSMVLSSKHRMAICNFFSKFRTRRLTSLEAEDFCGGDSSLVVSALSLGLDDSQPLVIRSILDLICAHFPAMGDWLSEKQNVCLLKAILTVLLQRDMSLSRRVYQWIFQDSSNSVEFDDTSPESPSPRTAKLLVQAIREMLQEQLEPKHLEDKTASIPFKVIIHLNDKATIMEAFFGDVVIDLFSFLSYLCQSSLSNNVNIAETYPKTILAAEHLFRVAELGQVWKTIISALMSTDMTLFSGLSEALRASIKLVPICDDEAAYRFAPLALGLVSYRFAVLSTTPLDCQLLTNIIDLFCAVIPKLSLNIKGDFDEVTPQVFNTILDDISTIQTANLNPLYLVLDSSSKVFSMATQSLVELGDAEYFPQVSQGLITLLDLLSVYVPDLKVREKFMKSSTVTKFVLEAHQIIHSSAAIELVDALSRVLLGMRKFYAAIYRTGEKQNIKDSFISPVLDAVLNLVWTSKEYAGIPLLVSALHEYCRNDIDGFFSRKLGLGTNLDRAYSVGRVADVWSSIGTLFIILLT